MSVQSYQIPDGARVLVFTCICGAPARFGTGCNILEALRTGDVSKAGTWTCGPDGCRQAFGSVCDFAQVGRSAVETAS